jgi:ATP-dependent Clp protease, protease subunit
MTQHNTPKNYLVPTVIERNPMGDRAYDIFSRLLNERIIFLGEEVNEHTANLVVAQMIHLAYEDSKKDILFYINSPGGSVYDGLAIIDTMNYIKPNVQTIGIGMQASMGAILLAAGTKGKRSLLPNSRVMIHQPRGGTEGVMTDMEISLKEGIRTKELIIDLMAKYTGQKKDKVRLDMERDFWMDAKEAVDYGVVDSVLDKA